jgi:hypothetical protein
MPDIKPSEIRRLTSIASAGAAGQDDDAGEPLEAWVSSMERRLLAMRKELIALRKRDEEHVCVTPKHPAPERQETELSARVARLEQLYASQTHVIEAYETRLATLEAKYEAHVAIPFG